MEDKTLISVQILAPNTIGLFSGLKQAKLTQRSPARDRNEVYSAVAAATSVGCNLENESLEADTFYNYEMSSFG